MYRIQAPRTNPANSQSSASAPPRRVDRRAFLALTGSGVGMAGLALAGTIGAGSATAAGAVRRSGISRRSSQMFSTAHIGGSRSEHITITVGGGRRKIATKSLPDHPLDSSYHYVAPPVAQDFDFEVSTTPALASSPTEIRTGFLLGVHLSSVIFDPDTANWYDDSMSSGWNENALSLDVYGAHTHPEAMTAADIDKGVYHYHRITDRWVSHPSRHSEIVGWAADGFPIYLRYGYVVPDRADHGVKNLASSYRLKSGRRPSGSPGGTYDGTYVADYEYVAGLGDLDQCNGRLCVTPEFPHGIYAYFLTDQWPYVPHWIRGTPDRSFSPGEGGTIAGGPVGGPGGGAMGGGEPGGGGPGGGAMGGGSGNSGPLGGPGVGGPPVTG